MRNKRALWTLYNLTKATATRPSELLELEQYFIENFDDTCLITRLSFDKAVTYFGNRVENLLLERDKDGNTINTLEDILMDYDEKREIKDSFKKFANVKGFLRVRKSKAGKK